MTLRGIEGRIAVVTGAASGLGRASATRLSLEGAKVVLVDRNLEGARRVAETLLNETLAVYADVSEEESVEGYMDATLERFGRVDLIHLNAGISGTFAPFTEIDVEEYDRVIAVNQRSVFLGLRAALRQFTAQGGGGAVVVTSSVAGLRGGHSLTPYSAAKHAILGLTQCAAVQGAALGIRVNAICPGIINTPLASLLDQEADGRLPAGRSHIPLLMPMRRQGEADEIGATVAFLLSDEASYLTGAIIPVDGGASANNPLVPGPDWPPTSAGAGARADGGRR
jgi:NAD(P)-dependent dehydrogenase (short-subunit alcohol dehydrogenase family)